jgi:hypothetical protein
MEVSSIENVLEVSTLSTIILMDFGNVLTVWSLFIIAFHLITQLSIAYETSKRNNNSK